MDNNGWQKALDWAIKTIAGAIVLRAVSYLLGLIGAVLLNRLGLEGLEPPSGLSMIFIAISIVLMVGYGYVYYFSIIKYIPYDSFGGNILFLITAIISLIAAELAFELYPIWILSLAVPAIGLYLKNRQIHNLTWRIKERNESEPVRQELEKIIFQLKRWRTLSGISAVSFFGFGIVAYFVLSFTPMPTEFKSTMITAPLVGEEYDVASWLTVARVTTDIVGSFLVVAFTGSGLRFIWQLERKEQMKEFHKRTLHLRALTS